MHSFYRSSTGLVAFIAVLTALVPSAARAQSAPAAFQVLHEFRDDYGDPLMSVRMARANNGTVYGAAQGEGQEAFIYSLARDDAGHWRAREVVYRFGFGDGRPTDLVVGGDGNLFALMTDGACDAVYKVALDGSQSGFIHVFNGAEGCWLGELLADPDGLYGITIQGDQNRAGTVFKLTYSGTLIPIADVPTWAESPAFGVVRGRDGLLYGTSPAGVYRISSSGQFSLICSPPCEIPDVPVINESPLVVGRDGRLYTTRMGSVVQIDPTTAAETFLPAGGGGRLIAGDDGYIYGVSGASVWRLEPASRNVTVLHAFTSVEGSAAAVVQTLEGDLLGITNQQKPIRGDAPNRGLVFTISLSTGFTIEMMLAIDAEGERPDTPLTLGPDGQWYGTTMIGGRYDVGTVFKLDGNGAFATLYHFPVSNGQLAEPAGLVRAGDNIYGVTRYGGDRGFGSIYRVTPAGDYAQLFSFGVQSAARLPAGAMAQVNGTMYGATYTGHLFSFTTAGQFTELAYDWRLQGMSRPLVAGRDGSLYGVNSTYDSNRSFLLKVGTDGGVSTVHEFIPSVEGYPMCVAQAPDGALYGMATTWYGGGTIFGVTASGDFKTLVTLDRDATGVPYPLDSCISGPDGRLYGVTFTGTTANSYSTGTPSPFQFDPRTGVFTRLAVEGTVGVRSSLTAGPDGWIYGVNQGTKWGAGGGLGAVFRFAPPAPADTTPPNLTLPAAVVAEATSPSGAAVTYAASAQDDVDGPVAIACAPASGSLFPIGTTTVNCSATDAHGNMATGSFTATVLGPSEITNGLLASISTVDFAQGQNLLQNALSSISSGNTQVACNQLNAFNNQARAQSGKKLTAPQAALVVQKANGAMAALGCR